MNCKKRCGKCCRESPKDCWLGSPLEWEEKQELLAKIEKKPKHNKGDCLMLWFNGKTAHCLIEDIYGFEKKEKNCRDYFCGE